MQAYTTYVTDKENNENLTLQEMLDSICLNIFI